MHFYIGLDVSLEETSICVVDANGTIRKELKAADGSFAMQNLQPQIQKVFEILGALPGVSIFSSEQELDAYLAAMQKKYSDEPKG